MLIKTAVNYPLRVNQICLHDNTAKLQPKAIKYSQNFLNSTINFLLDLFFLQILLNVLIHSVFIILFSVNFRKFHVPLKQFYFFNMSKEITNLKTKVKTNNVKRNFQFPKIDKEISKFFQKHEK